MDLNFLKCNEIDLNFLKSNKRNLEYFNLNKNNIDCFEINNTNFSFFKFHGIKDKDTKNSLDEFDFNNLEKNINTEKYDISFISNKITRDGIDNNNFDNDYLKAKIISHKFLKGENWKIYTSKSLKKFHYKASPYLTYNVKKNNINKSEKVEFYKQKNDLRRLSLLLNLPKYFYFEKIFKYFYDIFGKEAIKIICTLLYLIKLILSRSVERKAQDDDDKFDLIFRRMLKKHKKVLNKKEFVYTFFDNFTLTDNSILSKKLNWYFKHNFNQSIFSSIMSGLNKTNKSLSSSRFLTSVKKEKNDDNENKSTEDISKSTNDKSATVDENKKIKNKKTSDDQKKVFRTKKRINLVILLLNEFLNFFEEDKIPQFFTNLISKIVGRRNKDLTEEEREKRDLQLAIAAQVIYKKKIYSKKRRRHRFKLKKSFN